MFDEMRKAAFGVLFLEAPDIDPEPHRQTVRGKRGMHDRVAQAVR